MGDSDFYLFYIGGVFVAACVAFWIAHKNKVGSPVFASIVTSHEFAILGAALFWPIAIFIILIEVALRAAVRHGDPMSKTRMLLFGGVLLTAMLFFAGLILTFTMEDYFKSKAGNYIVQKIRPLTDNAADLLEHSLSASGLNDEQSMIVRKELLRYRNNPEAYLQATVNSNPRKDTLRASVEMLGIKFRWGDAKAQSKTDVIISQWRAALKKHFISVYKKLICDLRLFAASNTIGFMFAVFLVIFYSKWERKFMTPAILLIFSILLSIWFYWNDMTFFSLLTGCFMGWWYPVIIIVTFAYLMLNCYKHRRSLQK